MNHNESTGTCATEGVLARTLKQHEDKYRCNKNMWTAGGGKPSDHLSHYFKLRWHDVTSFDVTSLPVFLDRFSFWLRDVEGE